MFFGYVGIASFAVNICDQYLGFACIAECKAKHRLHAPFRRGRRPLGQLALCGISVFARAKCTHIFAPPKNAPPPMKAMMPWLLRSLHWVPYEIP